MLRPIGGRPEAAAAIWDWQGGAAEEGPQSGKGRTQLVATLQALAAAAVAFLFDCFWSETIGTVVVCIAGISASSFLVSPAGLYVEVHGDSMETTNSRTY